MKARFLLLVIMLLGAGAVFGTDVQFVLTDPQFSIAQTTNRQIIVQSESGTSVNNPNVLLPFKVTQFTSALGIATFSNLFGGVISGYYHVTIPAPPQRADFDIFVSNTNLGLVSASTIIGVFGASTYPAQTFAWSAQVSDARYAQNINNTVSFAQLIFTSNSIVSQFMAGDNAFGVSSTNYANSLSTALTNLGFTIGTAGSNNVQTLSNIMAVAINSAKTNSTATNLAWQALSQVTNVVNGVSPVISTNPTNDLQTAVTVQIVAATNALTSGLTASIINSSNVVELHVKNSTNDLQGTIVGQINQAGVASTNFSLLIGAQATNFANVGLTSTGALAFSYTTNLVANTSNSLLLKIDGTNIVNVAFSNAIASINGLGTNTTIRTGSAITVTNFQSGWMIMTNGGYFGTVGGGSNGVFFGINGVQQISFRGSSQIVIGPTNNNVPGDIVNDSGVGIIGGNNNFITDAPGAHMNSEYIFGGYGNTLNNRTISTWFDNTIFGGMNNTYFANGGNNSIIASSNCIITTVSGTGNTFSDTIIASRGSQIQSLTFGLITMNDTIVGGFNVNITNSSDNVAMGRNIYSDFNNAFIWASGEGGFNPTTNSQFAIAPSNGVRIVTHNNAGINLDGFLITTNVISNPTNDLNTALTAAINQLGVNDSNYSRLVTNGLNFATHPEVSGASNVVAAQVVASTNGVFAWGNAQFASLNNSMTNGLAVSSNGVLGQLISTNGLIRSDLTAQIGAATNSLNMSQYVTSFNGQTTNLQETTNMSFWSNAVFTIPPSTVVPEAVTAQYFGDVNVNGEYQKTVNNGVWTNFGSAFSIQMVPPTTFNICSNDGTVFFSKSGLITPFSAAWTSVSGETPGTTTYGVMNNESKQVHFGYFTGTNLNARIENARTNGWSTNNVGLALNQITNIANSASFISYAGILRTTTNIAYVNVLSAAPDSTAAIGNPNQPFASISNAITAIVNSKTYGVVALTPYQTNNTYGPITVSNLTITTIPFGSPSYIVNTNQTGVPLFGAGDVFNIYGDFNLAGVNVESSSGTNPGTVFQIAAGLTFSPKVNLSFGTYKGVWDVINTGHASHWYVYGCNLLTRWDDVNGGTPGMDGSFVSCTFKSDARPDLQNWPARGLGLIANGFQFSGGNWWLYNCDITVSNALGQNTGINISTGGTIEANDCVFHVSSTNQAALVIPFYPNTVGLTLNNCIFNGTSINSTVPLVGIFQGVTNDLTLPSIYGTGNTNLDGVYHLKITYDAGMLVFTNLTNPSSTNVLVANDSGGNTDNAPWCLEPITNATDFYAELADAPNAPLPVRLDTLGGLSPSILWLYLCKYQQTTNISLTQNGVFGGSTAITPTGISGNGAGLTNVTPIAPTIIKTNLSLATVGVNNWGRPIQICGFSVNLAEAGVAGVSGIQLEVPGQITNRVSSITSIAGTIIGSDTNALPGAFVPVGGTWNIRDISQGAGNSSSIGNGGQQIIIY